MRSSVLKSSVSQSRTLPLRAAPSRAARRGRIVVVALCAMLLWLSVAGSAVAKDYRRYFVGDRAVPTPGQVAPGLLLAGGGDRNLDAVRWFLGKAGNGHIVVLSASYTTEIADEFYRDAGGAASVETFVFKNGKPATDPAILGALARGRSPACRF